MLEARTHRPRSVDALRNLVLREASLTAGGNGGAYPSEFGQNRLDSADHHPRAEPEALRSSARCSYLVTWIDCIVSGPAGMTDRHAPLPNSLFDQLSFATR